jgi:hypothetical protein
MIDVFGVFLSFCTPMQGHCLNYTTTTFFQILSNSLFPIIQPFEGIECGSLTAALHKLQKVKQIVDPKDA